MEKKGRRLQCSRAVEATQLREGTLSWEELRKEARLEMSLKVGQGVWMRETGHPGDVMRGLRKNIPSGTMCANSHITEKIFGIKSVSQNF